MKKNILWKNVGVIFLFILVLFVPALNAEEDFNPSEQGWWIVSIPTTETTHKHNITIKNNTNTYTWEEAVENEIILDFVYTWDRDDGVYYLTDYFQSYYGYWMFFYDTSYNLNIEPEKTKPSYLFPLLLRFINK